jgi:hypothetical protein
MHEIVYIYIYCCVMPFHNAPLKSLHEHAQKLFFAPSESKMRIFTLLAANDSATARRPRLRQLGSDGVCSCSRIHSRLRRCICASGSRAKVDVDDRNAHAFEFETITPTCTSCTCLGGTSIWENSFSVWIDTYHQYFFLLYC